MTKYGELTTRTTSNGTDTGASFATGERLAAAQGDPDMFTVSVMIEPAGGTEDVSEDPSAAVSREDTDGHEASGSASGEQVPVQQVSLPLAELLSSDDLILGAQPESGEQERTTDEPGHDGDDSASELRKANEDLRAQLAERQREIEGLRRMLQVSADVIQAIPAGLFLFQYQPPGELFFLNCNPEATRLTGLGQEDCRGVELDEIWPNARTQGLTEAFLDAARTGKPFDAGKALYRNSKIERIFRIRAFAIPGERLGVALLELTDQKQTEEAVRRVRDEMDGRIEEATSELLARNQQLEAECSSMRLAQESSLAACRLEAQAEVAGRAARVLSNPIENLQETATRALARLDSGYISLVRPSLEQIVQDVKHACCLVKHLRQFAGIAPPGGASQWTTVDLNRVVSESAEALTVNGGGEGRNSVTPDLRELILGQDCCVKCEPSEMRDVVDAILQNVTAVSESPGGLRAKTFWDDDWVVLEVGDENTGISESDVSKMFEPLCASRSGHVGSGFAAVSGIVRRYGGEVGVVTSPDRGLIITIRLPRADAP